MYYYHNPKWLKSNTILGWSRIVLHVLIVSQTETLFHINLFFSLPKTILCLVIQAHQSFETLVKIESCPDNKHEKENMCLTVSIDLLLFNYGKNQ